MKLFSRSLPAIRPMPARIPIEMHLRFSRQDFWQGFVAGMFLGVALSVGGAWLIVCFVVPSL